MYGKTHFYLKHLDTGMYLYTDGSSKYNEANCRRCPIIGYSEVSGANGKTKNAIWKIHSGFFFPVNKEPKINYNNDDEEDNEDEDTKDKDEF